MGWNRLEFRKQNLHRAGRLVSGPQVKLGFTNRAHFKQILYIVHTLLVTTYIIPNRTTVWFLYCVRDCGDSSDILVLFVKIHAKFPFSTSHSV